MVSGYIPTKPLQTYTEADPFHEFFSEWVNVYKRGTVRESTLQKYIGAAEWLSGNVPHIKIGELDRPTYQRILNTYGKKREKSTVKVFHTLLKGAVNAFVGREYLSGDPTHGAIITGRPPKSVKEKYLSKQHLESLIKTLEPGDEPNSDLLILLLAKTGLRFSEALALTPADFNFNDKRLRIVKALNYTTPEGGFKDLKNDASRRTIVIDRHICTRFREVIKAANLHRNELIFRGCSGDRVFSSTVNRRLETLCEKIGATPITAHGLRHTHASVMIYAGVSIESISKRLGHSSISTTQNVYSHIIEELENEDFQKITALLEKLG